MDRLVAAALVAACAGCAGGTRVVEGHYSAGFEYSGFSPCADEPGGWSLAGNTDPIARVLKAMAEAAPDDPDPSIPRHMRSVTVYVRMRGTLTDEVVYGHLDMPLEVVQVAEVLEARPSSLDNVQDDCSGAGTGLREPP